MTSSRTKNISWRTLLFEIDSERAAFAAAIIAELTGNGVQTEERDDEHTSRLTAYIEEGGETEARLQQVREFIERLSRSGKAEMSEGDHLEDQDWCGEWKKQFKPFRVGEGLVVRPTWEEYQPAEGETVITLDPGMAFGTGHHESTSMAMELIDSLYRQSNCPARVLDLGCGTGILAITAAALGAVSVSAIDNDPQAVDAARDNIRINKMTDRITPGLPPAGGIEQRFDLVCANIIHNTLVDLAEMISNAVDDSGFLILAGILSGWQEKNLIRIYGELGLDLIKTRHRNEWAALLFSRGPRP